MKTISLYCLLVNLTSSSKKKKKGGVWMRCFSLTYSQTWTHAVIIPRLFLWESDAALGKHKEVREHPWTLSKRGHWYSNNMQTPFDCAKQRAFQIQHLHVTLCPFLFLKFKKLFPYLCGFWQKRKKPYPYSPSIDWYANWSS